jgi:hypothetical protein
MKHSPLPREAVSLPDSVHRRLNMYVLVASAAGLGSSLALVQPSDAKIIYTPACKRLPINQHFFLDLNHDGTADFLFLTTSSCRAPKAELYVRPEQNENRIVGSFQSAAALRPRARIGPRARFVGNDSYARMAQMFTTTNGEHCIGPWANACLGVRNRYLGLKFAIKGKIHFGWARLNVRPDFCGRGKFDARLTGYAYETVPGKPIIAGATKGPHDDAQPTPASISTQTPAPATLGMLALGAPGLAIWRREESVADVLEGN